jgi:hypothetical protein
MLWRRNKSLALPGIEMQMLKYPTGFLSFLMGLNQAH